jgi:hypothetical protein
MAKDWGKVGAAGRGHRLRGGVPRGTVQGNASHRREQGMPMADNDAPDEISQLEERIDDLAESLARSQRILQISQVAIAGGAVWILATIVGAIGFNSAAVISAIAAMIGGVVLFGSTTTTLKQTSARMKAAEVQRAELIDRMDLRVVGESAGEQHRLSKRQ